MFNLKPKELESFIINGVGYSSILWIIKIFNKNERVEFKQLCKSINLDSLKEYKKRCNKIMKQLETNLEES